MDKPLHDIRREYTLTQLSEDSADADPLRQFDVWFDEATKHVPLEPNGMALATVGADGRPTARIVLLKAYDQRGFVFFTNLASRKGQELAVNPNAALLFWWSALERQVRIEGKVTVAERPEAEAYFATRPRDTQLGACASPQSHPITRDELEMRMEAVRKQYDGAGVPCPSQWGGYRLRPDYYEFWQGRAMRLHDRLAYERDGEKWRMSRIAP
ncbi:MAG: pyridoxamine 5'-phosphate oxidase [Phycisphaerales bacterium]|nr:pyridoxamine 5'-phosphate oxidase [Phycisphaerales bacterium]